MLKSSQIFSAKVNLSPEKNSHITLAWLKCSILQSNQTLKRLEFDLQFFSTKKAVVT